MKNKEYKVTHVARLTFNTNENGIEVPHRILFLQTVGSHDTFIVDTVNEAALINVQNGDIISTPLCFQLHEADPLLFMYCFTDNFKIVKRNQPETNN